MLALAHPLPFGLGTVDTLELELGPLRFPLDLSGGAARFRTRRTRILSASVRIDLAALLRDRVGPPERLVALAPSGDDALSWALTDAFGTVAFDARARAEGADVWLAIEGARSAGHGPAPPLVRVLAAARSLGLELDEARGALRLTRVLSGALMEALVPHGWRIPDDRGVRLAVSVLGRRRIALRTLSEGELEAAHDPAPWERARRVAPIAAALARGEREEALRADEALRERLGALPAPLAREVDALTERASDGGDPLARTVALRRAVREGRAEEAARQARALAGVEPCDAVAVEALCAAAEIAQDPAEQAALLELARARRPRDDRLALRLVEALSVLPDAAALRAAIDAALDGREPGRDRAELAREAALVCELAARADEADRLFRLAARSLSSDPRVIAGVARAEERAGHHEEAHRLWDRAADALTAATADAEEIARALTRSGRAAERLGRLDVAEERLARAAERAPGEAEVWAALARVRRAMTAARSAMRAEDALLETVEGLAAGTASPEIRDALAAAARAALEAGEPARATSFADALARAHADDPALRAELGSGAVAPTPLARARTAALARDTAGLRAALRAAERDGDLDAARAIVTLALEVVGEGPARRYLEEARERLR